MKAAKDEVFGYTSCVYTYTIYYGRQSFFLWNKQGSKNLDNCEKQKNRYKVIANLKNNKFLNSTLFVKN